MSEQKFLCFSLTKTRNAIISSRGPVRRQEKMWKWRTVGRSKGSDATRHCCQPNENIVDACTVSRARRYASGRCCRWSLSVLLAPMANGVRDTATGAAVPWTAMFYEARVGPSAATPHRGSRWWSGVGGVVVTAAFRCRKNRGNFRISNGNNGKRRTNCVSSKHSFFRVIISLYQQILEKNYNIYIYIL